MSLTREEQSAFEAVLAENLTTFHAGPPPYEDQIEITQVDTGGKWFLMVSRHINEKGWEVIHDSLSTACASEDPKAVKAILVLWEAESRLLSAGMNRKAGEA